MLKPQVKNKFKLNFFWMMAILISVTLLIALILTILTPKKEKVVANDFVVNNYDNTQSTFKKINYSGGEINAPEFFNIYQSSNSLGLAEELAQKIIIDKQLSANSAIENYWVGEKSALAKNSSEQYYILNNTFDEEGNNNLPIIANEAIEVCQNFYSKYNISLPLIVQKDSIIYLSSGFEQNIVSPQEATFLQIPLTYELNGYKVFYENQNDYPFFCRVNNFYNLERVVFRDFFQEFQVSKQMPSISIDQAIGNIKKGSASIIDAESEIAKTIDLNWINEADLYSAEIEYRYDGKLKIAYPFYRFKAKLTNSAGINIIAEVITPAVASAVEK